MNIHHCWYQSLLKPPVHQFAAFPQVLKKHHSLTMAEFLEETDVLATEEDVSNVGEGDMTSDTNEDPVRRKITSF